MVAGESQSIEKCSEAVYLSPLIFRTPKSKAKISILIDTSRGDKIKPFYLPLRYDSGMFSTFSKNFNLYRQR